MKKKALLPILLAAAVSLSAAPPPASAFRTSLDAGWSFALGNAASMEADFGHGTEYFTYFTKVMSNHENHGPASTDFIEDGSCDPAPRLGGGPAL